MSSVAPRLAARVPGGRIGARTHVTWALFMLVATLHTAGVVLQPFLAGAFLAGHYDALAMHSGNGGVLLLTGWVQAVAAVLLCVPGRAPWWVPLLAIAISIAELVQIITGNAFALAVHVPMGVGIVLAVVGLYAWAIHWRLRLGRAAWALRAQSPSTRPSNPSSTRPPIPRRAEVPPQPPPQVAPTMPAMPAMPPAGPTPPGAHS